MGRPISVGLKYFPLDVTFFDDEKIQFLTARYGQAGEAIAIRILCKIYNEGCAWHFNDDVAMLFARHMGDVSQVEFIKNVVKELLKRKFFDEEIFMTKGLLTSRGIQKRYTDVCTKSKWKTWSIPDEINLLNKPDLITNLPGLIQEEPITKPEVSAQTEREEKKIEKTKKNENVSANKNSLKKTFRRKT